MFFLLLFPLKIKICLKSKITSCKAWKINPNFPLASSQDISEPTYKMLKPIHPTQNGGPRNNLRCPSYTNQLTVFILFFICLYLSKANTPCDKMWSLSFYCHTMTKLYKPSPGLLHAMQENNNVLQGHINKVLFHKGTKQVMWIVKDIPNCCAMDYFKQSE